MGCQATGTDLPQLSHKRSSALSNAQPSVGLATAQPSIQANGPPGLKAVLLPHMATLAALAECQTAVDNLQTDGKHRAVEIGKPYLDKKQHQSAFPITDFPEVEALIRAAHAGFGHAEPQWDRINVIIRSYRKGGTLTPHVDRPDVFGKDVYTCVLAKT